MKFNLIDLFKGIWLGIVYASLFGVIIFVTISCCLAWLIAGVLIIHLKPDYNMAYLSFLIILVIRIFVIEVIILITYFILVPCIIKLLKGGNKNHGKHKRYCKGIPAKENKEHI